MSNCCEKCDAKGKRGSALYLTCMHPYCPCHSTPEGGKWIDQFYALYMKGRKGQKAPQSYIDYFQARNFISDLLSSQRATLRSRVEGMERPKDNSKLSAVYEGALKDVLALIDL